MDRHSKWTTRSKLLFLWVVLVLFAGAMYLTVLASDVDENESDKPAIRIADIAKKYLVAGSEDVLREIEKRGYVPRTKEEAKEIEQEVATELELAKEEVTEKAMDVIRGQVIGGNLEESYDAEYEFDQLQDAKLSYISKTLIRQRELERMAHRIDCYFDARRSPMKGLGRHIVLSAERYGHDPRLCAAIAEAESTCGLACFSPHNAWGMLAYRSGFASWEQGVDAMFDWLFKYNGVCTSAPRNWCEPPDPWRSNVNKVMNSI